MTNSFSDFSCFLLLFWHFWGGTNQVFCTCPSKRGFPHSSVGKESAYSAGDLSSIPGSGKSPGEGIGNPLQCSCLENFMDRKAWKTTVHGISKSRTRLIYLEKPVFIKRREVKERVDILSFVHHMISIIEVTQSCPTLCDPVDCSPPSSSIHGILQARILEWVAIFFSRGSSRPGGRTHISCIGRRILYFWLT